MTSGYKTSFLILSLLIFLFFLTGFQITIINGYSFRFNIFLFLTILLIFFQKFYSAIIFSWFSGFLIDTVHFSTFGTSSLIFLILTGFLIFFHQKALLTSKIEGILIISLVSILIYHILDWAADSIINLEQGGLNLYFLNSGIIIEILVTAAFLLAVFKCLKITTLEKIN